MSMRRFRSVRLSRSDRERLVDEAAGTRPAVYIDLAKEELYAAVTTGSNEVRTIVRFRQPEEVGAFVGLLRELCMGRRALSGLRARDFMRLARRLGHSAPEHYVAPGGARCRIRQEPGRPPVISARIQELFGLEQNPEIAGVTCLVELLAPNLRPAQLTTDIGGFRTGSYLEVRKELRGRYPKHRWPERPTVEDARRR